MSKLIAKLISTDGFLLQVNYNRPIRLLRSADPLTASFPITVNPNGHTKGERSPDPTISTTCP